MKKVFPTIASVLALSSAAFTADAAYTVVAESLKPVTITTSDSYTNVGSFEPIGGIYKSATYTNISGFNIAFADISTIKIVTSLEEVSMVLAGEDLTLQVEATADDEVSYQWKKDGAIINGATESSYTISGVTADEEGVEYSVDITAGTLSKTLTTTVDVFALPAIVGMSEDATLEVGNALELSVSVDAGDAEAVTYEWTKRDTVVSTESTYSVESVTASDAAVYTVTVSTTFKGETIVADSGDVTINITNPGLPAPFVDAVASLEYDNWYNTFLGDFFWKESWGDYISSYEHGTLYIDPDGTADGYWFYDNAVAASDKVGEIGAWFWTSKSSYPAIYSATGNKWLIYVKSESVPGSLRFFWDSSKEGDDPTGWIQVNF